MKWEIRIIYFVILFLVGWTVSDTVINRDQHKEIVNKLDRIEVILLDNSQSD